MATVGIASPLTHLTSGAPAVGGAGASLPPVTSTVVVTAPAPASAPAPAPAPVPASVVDVTAAPKRTSRKRKAVPAVPAASAELLAGASDSDESAADVAIVAVVNESLRTDAHETALRTAGLAADLTLSRGVAAEALFVSLEGVSWPPGRKLWHRIYAATSSFWSLLAASGVLRSLLPVSKRSESMPSAEFCTAALQRAGMWVQAMSRLQALQVAVLHTSAAPAVRAGPELVKRPTHGVFGTVTSAAWAVAASELRLSIEKDAKGYFMVAMGARHQNKALFKFPKSTQPSMSHVVGAQLNLVADVAVMNCADAMLQYTSIVSAIRFGTNVERVKAALVSGCLFPLDIFDKPVLCRSLLNAENAVHNLADLCREMYDVSCPLTLPLLRLSDRRGLSTQHAELMQYSGLSDLAATDIVFRRFDVAMADWERSARACLEPWFGQCSTALVAAQESSDLTGGRVVSCMPAADFAAQVDSWDSCLNAAMARLTVHTAPIHQLVARDAPKPAFASDRHDKPRHVRGGGAAAKSVHVTFPTAAQAAPVSKSWPNVPGPAPSWVTSALSGKNWFEAVSVTLGLRHSPSDPAKSAVSTYSSLIRAWVSVMTQRADGLTSP